MGRGRLKSGLQAFGAGRLRRVPSLTIDQVIVDPPNPPKPPSGNEDVSNGGIIITPSKPGGPPDFTDTGVETVGGGGGGKPVGGGPLIIGTMPFLGEKGPVRDEDDTLNQGGGPGRGRSLPASLPTRTPQTRNFPAPKTVVNNPAINAISVGKIEFSGGITNTSPTILTIPEFSPGARSQGLNDYIKENLLVYSIHASDMIGSTASGSTYQSNVTKYFTLLDDLFTLDADGRSRSISRDTSPKGLSAAGFPVRARTLDNFAEGDLQSGGSGANFFSQQFFRYDLTGNGGVTGLIAGDTITKASLILSVDSHMVDRQSAPAYTGDTISFVQGPASVPERVFEAIKINATFDADFGWYLSGTSWGFTYGWDSFYGTSGSDVDTTKKVEFTISKPLKKGEKIKLDLTSLATDALANANGILRFAIRPKATQYGITGISGGSPASGSGIGLNIFGIDRQLDKPELFLSFNPSNSSTKERLARLIRGK